MEHTIDFTGLQRTISSGAAVCLLGAGFSRLAMQADGSGHVPSTEELTNEIKALLGIPALENLSLADASDFAEESASARTALNQLLIKKLTSTDPADSQIWLLNLAWRAIFTTNFDDVIEVSCTGKNRVPVTPLSDIATVPVGKTPVYYLHGRALDLRENDKDPSIVISESNYLKLDTRNRGLYARLLNEILCARAVFSLDIRCEI